MVQRAFDRAIGIDYSGAKTPTDRLPGLRVYCADGNAPPHLKRTRGRRRNETWTRKEIAEWLVDLLREDSKRTLVGIDHAFSFPIRYFCKYGLLGRSWDYFLDDFRRYWPTDGDNVRVSEIRGGWGGPREGDPEWLRETDLRTATAISAFQFNSYVKVSHSTHAGIPWLRHIRQKLGDRVHFWPFDEWDIPHCKSAIAEVYPALWNRRFPDAPQNNDDKRDAYCIAKWMQHVDQHGWLGTYLHPHLTNAECNQAMIEGWILGVM